MIDEEKQTIKDLYKDLLEVAEVNHPDYYMMSLTFYKSICSRILEIERALVNSRKSRDSWRKKYETLINDSGKLGGKNE